MINLDGTENKGRLGANAILGVSLANVKAVAEELGYATDNKLYKANPEAYKGNTAKACEFVRLALTGRKNSPDLYEIMKILGNEKVNARFKSVLN